MREPRHSSEVLVSDVNRAFVTQWIRKYAADRPGKALVLMGPSGCGMSTLATLCFRENCMDVISISGASYRGCKKLRLALHEALMLPLKRVVLVEEPEALVSDGGLSELAQFVRKKSRIPVVAVCNKHRKPKIGPLLQAAEVVQFAYLSRLTLTRKFGELPACVNSGDMRQITISLLSGLKSERDYHMDVSEGAKSLLAGQRVQQAHCQFSVDGQTYVNLIHENYGSVSKDIHTAAAVADDISASDLLPEEAAYLTGAVLPGYRLRKIPATLRPDTVWTKQTFALTRWRDFRPAAEHFAGARNTVDIYSLPLIRQQLSELASKEEWEHFISWAPCASTQHFTTILRTGTGRQNTTLLSRVRRALKRLDI